LTIFDAMFVANVCCGLNTQQLIVNATENNFK
jgi:hypothetical protein